MLLKFNWFNLLILKQLNSLTTNGAHNKVITRFVLGL